MRDEEVKAQKRKEKNKNETFSVAALRCRVTSPPLVPEITWSRKVIPMLLFASEE